MLRNYLHHAMPTPRSVLVTSAEVGAGKSSVTANLGISLAQAECRVLLVDADLRRPVLHTLLQVPSAVGLSSYLAGTAELETVVARTSVPNLSVIPSGPFAGNPSDLLFSRRMRELLQAVTEQYDVVLLDSPPVLAASDATTLAPVVDGILLVIGGKVPQFVVRRATEQLEAVHGHILGAVVNQRQVRQAGRRAFEGLARVPHAAVGLSGPVHGLATLGVAAAARSRHGLQAAGRGVLSGVSGAARAGVAGLERAGRGASTLGAAAVARSRHGLQAAGRGVLSGVSGAARAGVAGLERAGRGASTLGGAVVASGRGLQAAGRGVLSGVSGAARAGVAGLERAGRGASTLGGAAAARSRHGLQAAGRGVLSGVSGAARAGVAGLERAGRGASTLGGAVVARSRHGLQAAGRGALSALTSASRAAVRLRDTGQAMATLGAGVVGTRRRRLVRAASGLTPARQTWAGYLGSPGRAAVVLGMAVAASTQRQFGHERWGAWRTPMTAVGGFATGLAMVLIGAGLLGWPVVSSDRTPPIVGKVSARQESSTSPIEVVAIRFGVVDRRQPDWKWSWRVTVYKPSDAARVNARIEYVEFQGSTRRLVGYEDLCGLRLAGGRLESIQGNRTISAADSRRISAMTATFSDAPESADPAACRPGNSWTPAS